MAYGQTGAGKTFSMVEHVAVIIIVVDRSN
jgi:hypothetical protein